MEGVSPDRLLPPTYLLTHLPTYLLTYLDHGDGKELWRDPTRKTDPTEGIVPREQEESHCPCK